MALISCPDCGQHVSDAAPACLRCGRPIAGHYSPPQAAGTVPVSPAAQPLGRSVGVAAKGMTWPKAVTTILVGATLAAVAVGALGYELKDRPAEGASPSATAKPDPPPRPPPEPESPVEHIDKLGYADALAYATPQMRDTADQDSAGTVLFGLWATEHMKWTDVNVANDETSFAVSRKDPDGARGKRLCTSGQVVQIEVQKGRRFASAEGLINSWSGNLYNFIAAGSSGSLVQQSQARFCGVVTGNYDYANSAGGTGHAVSLVGMFDLPENKPKTAGASRSVGGGGQASAPAALAEDVCPDGWKWNAGFADVDNDSRRWLISHGYPNCRPPQGTAATPVPAATAAAPVTKHDCGCNGDQMCLMKCAQFN